MYDSLDDKSALKVFLSKNYPVVIFLNTNPEGDTGIPKSRLNPDIIQNDLSARRLSSSLNLDSLSGLGGRSGVYAFFFSSSLQLLCWFFNSFFWTIAITLPN